MAWIVLSAATNTAMLPSSVTLGLLINPVVVADQRLLSSHSHDTGIGVIGICVVNQQELTTRVWRQRFFIITTLAVSNPTASKANLACVTSAELAPNKSPLPSLQPGANQ
jgi:hypothetical protein